MKRLNPLVVCITGGIGSGKSVVSRVLRLNGYKVYDCDSEAKILMESDPNVRTGIIKILGNSAFDRNGKLDRRYIASIIFSDAEKRKEVNRIVHEAVRRDFERFVKKQNDIVFCETAIPVSSHLNEDCDEIWLVEAPETLRVERVAHRNGLSDKEIRERMRSQEEEFDKITVFQKRIIDNGGSTPLLPQIFKKLGINKNNEEICLEIF